MVVCGGYMVGVARGSGLGGRGQAKKLLTNCKRLCSRGGRYQEIQNDTILIIHA